MSGREAGPGVSVAMIVRDEEDRIERALRSVAWADEVVVVDGGSRDATAAVAADLGARVLETGEWPGFPEQRRRSVEACAGPWILVLDADEEVPPALAREIQETLSAAAGPSAGYEILRHTQYLGHWFGRRGWFRERHLRLARKEALRVTERRVHEGLEVDGPVARLRNPILHYSYRSVSHHQRKMAEYARLKARDLYDRGQRATLATAAAHSLGRLFTGYLLQGRFLDGWAGLVHELLASEASLLAYLELWELGRGGGAGPDAGD